VQHASTAPVCCRVATTGALRHYLVCALGDASAPSGWLLLLVLPLLPLLVEVVVMVVVWGLGGGCQLTLRASRAVGWCHTS
jgi:hypothetical protein